MKRKQTASSIMDSLGGEQYDGRYDGYEKFLPELQENFDRIFEEGKGRVFTTNATNLWNIYLKGIPDYARQHYNCHACRRFVEKYGGLVIILKNGKQVPLMWDKFTVPDFFKDSVEKMANKVQAATVTGVFYHKHKTWGLPYNDGWHHMHIKTYKRHYEKGCSSSQLMAEKREDYKTIRNAVYEYPVKVLETAVSLLQGNHLYRSEKVLGMAQRFLDLHNDLSGIKYGKHKNNIIWKYVADVPPGYCHIKSSMIGTLLEDIASGGSFQGVSKRFAKKMEPTKYQRPSELPKAGNIARANKIFSELESEGSLDRRFARIKEVPLIWEPSKEKKNKRDKGVGIFSDLPTREQRLVDGSPNLSEVPISVITARKFMEEIAPQATSIKMRIENHTMNFVALTTSIDLWTTPILQWDNQYKHPRNPVSGYVYSGGSMPNNWRMQPYTDVEVTGICKNPAHWYGNIAPHQNEGLIFILKGCKDTRYRNAGLGIFPENLKSKFREIRSTIEAYSQRGTLKGYYQATACGIRFDKNGSANLEVQVNLSGMIFKYKIDRWD